MVGILLRASVGFCPLVAPLFVLSGGLVRCGLALGCALPAVHCPWSCVLLSLVRGPSLAVIALCRCFCLCGYGRLSRGRRAPFCGRLGLLFAVVGLAVVGSPPLPIIASLPPAVGPLWRPGPGFSLVPPSGYLVASVTAWLPCLPCWGCGCALSPSLHCVSWQQRPLALCGVCFPSTP